MVSIYRNINDAYYWYDLFLTPRPISLGASTAATRLDYPFLTVAVNVGRARAKKSGSRGPDGSSRTAKGHKKAKQAPGGGAGPDGAGAEYAGMHTLGGRTRRAPRERKRKRAVRGGERRNADRRKRDAIA